MPVAAQNSALEGQFEEASRLVRAQTDSGDVAAAVLHVRRAGQEMSRAFGAARIDLPFLIASPTKPMTASGVLWLRDRRELALSDPVSKYLPAFRDGERGDVTIRHLLTHTSGLPDMLPENTELRAQHAPLSEFVARTCRTPLLFRPWDEGELPEHGHPSGRGDRREGQRRADAGIPGADDLPPAADAADVVGSGRSTRSRIPPSARCRKPNAVIGTGTARTGGTSAPHGAARMPRRTIWRHSWKPSRSPMARCCRQPHAARCARFRLARCGHASASVGSASRESSAGRAPRRRSDTSGRPARWPGTIRRRPRRSSCSRPDRPPIPRPVFFSPPRRSLGARTADASPLWAMSSNILRSACSEVRLAQWTNYF